MGRRAGLQQDARHQSSMGERRQREGEGRAEAEELGAGGAGGEGRATAVSALLFPLFFFGAHMLGIGLGGGQRGACNERRLHRLNVSMIKQENESLAWQDTLLR